MTRLVAVTGATGFVGGHALCALAARGWRLRILARRWPTLPPELRRTPVETVPGDLGDRQALDALVRGVDAVIHLAGAIKSSRAGDFEKVNVAGTANLVQAWRTVAPDAPLIAMSSMAAREPGLSSYAASKRAAEAPVRGSGGRWTILRPCAVYGPLDRETLKLFRLADARWQAMVGGRRRICLVHAADLAEAVAALLDDPRHGQIFEVSDERATGYAWREIMAAAARALGRPPRPAPLPDSLLRAAGLLGDGLGRLGVDAPGSDKMREALHDDWSSALSAQPPRSVWRPRIGLEQGFTETVAAYRSAGLLGPTRGGGGRLPSRTGGAITASRSSEITETR